MDEPGASGMQFCMSFHAGMCGPEPASRLALLLIAAPPHTRAQVHKLKSVPDIEAELRGRQKLGKETSVYESDDDDDMPRGQRVQCAQS